MEGAHESLWIATAPGGAHPRLEEDLQVDVAIVGGGMVGLATAYLLQKQGRSVAVLEAGRILSGVTGHTTAKLTSQHGLRYHDLQDRFGAGTARLYGEANQAALHRVQEMARELGVDAQMERAPAYTYTTDASEVEKLRLEGQVSKDLGLPASFVTETELPFDVAGAVRFEDQAHFHPRRLLLAMADRIVEQGGRLFEGSPVLEVKDGTPCTVRTAEAKVTADHVVVATHAPINDKASFVSRMKPVRAYGIAVRVPERPLEGMHISSGPPVRSVRPSDADGPMLVIVGENHPVGEDKDTQRHHEALIRFAREHFDVRSVAYRWSTQDLYPVDGMPFIGRMGPTQKHVWTATGFQGWGMTHSVVAAMLISDELTGAANPWTKMYDPFAPGRVAKDLVQPKLAKLGGHVAKTFIQGRMRDEDVAHLAPGDGEVTKVEGRPVAVHRDEKGVLHARSAKCTHMGCIVDWNRGEQSWDCPCHGSRFGPDGEVLHAPATRPLDVAPAEALDEDD